MGEGLDWVRRPPPAVSQIDGGGRHGRDELLVAVVGLAGGVVGVGVIPEEMKRIGHNK